MSPLVHGPGERHGSRSTAAQRRLAVYGPVVVEFRILGPLEVVRDGRTLDLGRPRERAVLALLLLQPGAVVSTERIVDELWGEAPPPTARHAVQVHVSRLRKVLGPDVLLTRPPGYVLDLGDHDLDAVAFESLAVEGRAAVRSNDPRRAADLLRQALARWRGSVLQDLGDPDFVAASRARLDSARADAAEDLLEARLVLGEHADVAREAERLVAEEPLRERRWGLLMLARYRAGRQAEALEAYRQARHLLREELGIEPGRDLRELHGAILRHDPGLDWEPPATGAVRHNLPFRRSSFVGRGPEREALAGLLDAARLVTVTGPAGVGKTRLTLEVATATLGRFRDGTFLVELAPLREAALVLPAVAKVLDVAVAPTGDPLEPLGAFLADREILLVLDNVEHLPEAAPDVSRLLDAAPDLTVLATSRAPLRIDGEHEFPLGALDTGESSDAVRLFVDRARAADPAFRAEDAASIAAVVRRLDGLPLAIELAAARTKVLAPADLLARLDRHLALDVPGPVDAPERHRTLRDAIAWSHDLLDDAPATLLARLAVFAGAFDVRAAERIVSGDPVRDVVDDLATLVDHSLVQRAVEPDGIRFRLLETVREFAQERLEARGELAEFRARHAEALAALAEEAEPHLVGEEQPAWFRRLEARLDDIRVALRWSLGDGDVTVGLRIAAAIWRFWQRGGYLAEARRWLDALTAGAGEPPPRLRGRVYEALGGIAYWQGAHADAFAAYETALAAYRECGDRRREAEALSSLVMTATWLGDLERADVFEREATAVYAALGDTAAQLRARLFSAVQRVFLGEFEEGRRRLEALLPDMPGSGSPWLEGQAQVGLARALVGLGEFAAAETRALTALGYFHAVGDVASVAQTLDWVSLAVVQQGDVDRGVRLAAAADALREEAGGGLTMQARGLDRDPRDVAFERADPEDVERAWKAGRELCLDEAVALAGLSPVSVRGGRA